MTSVSVFTQDPAQLLPLLHEWMQAHAALGFRPDYETAFCNWIQSRYRKDDSVVLVAEEDGQFVGMAIAYIVDNGPIVLPPKIGFINILVVLPGYRRKGIARRLRKALEEWFAAQNVSELQLYTLTGNEPARSFWKVQGYDVKLERRVKRLPMEEGEKLP